MPAVPVISSISSLSAWPLWQKGRISAANVTWSVDATDSEAKQTLLLSNLAIAKGYNAIRLVLSAGSSLYGWVDMGNIATYGWSDTSNPLLTTSQSISEIASNIDKILVKCSQLGLGVILDCHDFFQRDQDDGSVGMLWEGSDAVALRQKLQDFWTVTVQRWGRANWAAVWAAAGQDPAAVGPWPGIGYEILNEPNPNTALTFAQMQAGEDNNWWLLADKCIKAIRVLDTETPIVVDGIYYGDAYGLAYFNSASAGAPGLLKDYDYSGGGYTIRSAASARIVYSFHVYAPHDFTHQGVVDGLYQSLGTPYPLPSTARVLTRVFDGSVSSGSTEKILYLPYTSASDLAERLRPALNFNVANPSVPIFVGEFSAVNPALLKSNQVDTSKAQRAITGIEVDGSGAAKVWLGNLTDGFNINVFPFATAFSAPPSNDPYNGYGGAYSDYAKATIKVVDSVNNAVYEIANVNVRLQQGWKYLELTYPSGSRPAAGTLGLAGVSASNPQVATLTLAPRADAASVDAARVRYNKDVLSICLSNRFSWGYWAEDGYLGLPDDTALSGVFIGWRPSTAISALLTKVATRRTVA